MNLTYYHPPLTNPNRLKSPHALITYEFRASKPLPRATAMRESTCRFASPANANHIRNRGPTGPASPAAYAGYSVRNDFTGFCRAALMACTLTVSNVMNSAPPPARANTHQESSVR